MERMVSWLALVTKQRPDGKIFWSSDEAEGSHE
jgi:hypothetical protein